ncbi:hypothetical protein [Svornostia abyssi]|uniref:hypothetical protein n=1 Tax=Svornostia abyssi TaxID=2898438 RepID=UPI00338EA070
MAGTSPGSFSEIGGVDRLGLAHVLADGSVDAGFDAGLSGYVDPRALALDGGTLYVGGTLGAIGGGQRTGLAAVDAVTGDLLPFDAQLDGDVRALELHGGRLYVGGLFDVAGGSPRAGAAAFSTATGALTAFAPQLADGDQLGSVAALDAGGGWLYVTGGFDTAAGATHERIVAVDLVTGAPNPAWTPRLDQVMPYVAYAPDTQTVFAGGAHAWLNRDTPGQQFSALHGIDAGGSAEPGLPWTGGCSSMTLVGPILYLACLFSEGARYPMMVRGYDVRTWTEVFSARLRGDASTGDSEVRAIGAAGGVVVVGGFFQTIGGRVQDRLAAVDIATGEALPFNPGADGTVRALTVVDGDLVAGGDFTTVGGATRRGLARLDPLTGAPRAWDPNVTGGGVRALARDGNALYAGGEFTSVGGQVRTLAGAVALDTGAPLAFAPQVTGTRVNALAVDDDGVLLGGRFTAVGGAPRAALAAVDPGGAVRAGWDAALATAGGAPEVHALARDGADVFAGGAFTSAGGAARRHVAALDAADGGVRAWDAGLTEGISVQAIAVRDDDVLLGGSRTPPAWDGDTAIFSRHRRSDGRAVESLIEIDSVIRALHVDRASVYLGGSFAWVGIRPRARRSFTSLTSPPENERSPAVTGTLEEGETLTCAPGGWANDPVTYTYAWLRDGNAIDGATAATRVVTAADAAAAVTCSVTARNRGGAASAVSAPAGSPAPPSADALPMVTGTAAYASELTCALGTWSGSVTSQSVQWLRDGDLIDGATAATYTLVNPDAGRAISCRVTSTGAGGQTAATSAVVTVPDRPVLTGAPAITGTAAPGETLTCTAGTWTSATVLGYAYTWRADGVVAATGSTYTVAEADRTRTLQCEVVATNDGGFASALTAGVVVPGLPPVNTAVPRISGTARAGGVLTCTPGSWTGPVDGREYEWHVDGETRLPFPNDRLTLTGADRGKSVRCRETARSWQWGAAAADSAAVIVGSDPPSTGAEPPAGGTPPTPAADPSPPADTPPPPDAAPRTGAPLPGGTPAPIRLTGGRGADVLRGMGGDDRLAGGAGDDRLHGGAGRDRLTGGPGRDALDGGPGDDVLDARDAAGGDRLTCGAGRDRAFADRGDRVARDCERVIRR